MTFTIRMGLPEMAVLGIEPHPEDTKNGAYKRIKLSVFPPATPKLP